MVHTTQKKRQFQGTVVSDRMTKTRVVEVVHTKFHSQYQKRYPVTQRFKCHDEKNECKTGDKVVIEETRPLSKEKRWTIVGKQ